MYIERRWNCGAVVDVQKVMPRRQIPKGKRAPRQNPTPQAVAAYNEKLARWKLSRILNAAFGLGDQHLILTYRQEDRPASPEEAKARVRDYLGQVRRFFRARGLELKYVHVPAVSKRGVPHHHLVLNTGTLSPEDRRGLRALWPWGSCRGVELYTDDLSSLAAYLLDQGKNGQPVPGKRWTTSRNVKDPIPREREVDAQWWQDPPRPMKGYVIDPASVEAGENPVTGQPYLYYRMVRVPEGRNIFTAATQGRLAAARLPVGTDPPGGSFIRGRRA